MLNVKPTWLIRLKLHKQANKLLFQCSSTGSDKNDKNDNNIHTEGDLKVTENGKKSTKEHETRKDIPSPENFTNRENRVPRARRRSFSPGERVASLLSEEIVNNDDGLHENKQNKDLNQSNSNLNEDKEKTPTRQSNDFMKQRFKARLKVQPSKRLASMLPENYWQSLDDTETKNIVDDLGDSVNADSNKEPEK